MKHTLIIRDKKTRAVLKRFEYPSRMIPNKFFWEKMKQEEVSKLLKARDIMSEDIITYEQIDSVNV